MKLDEMISVMTQYKIRPAGCTKPAVVQHMCKNTNREQLKWIDCVGEPVWNWALYDYRIKPEPREFWINVYSDGAEGFAHQTKELAMKNRAETGYLQTIKVVEVEE